MNQLNFEDPEELEEDPKIVDMSDDDFISQFNVNDFLTTGE